MPKLRLNDLERSCDIGVIVGATFLGLYAEDNDIEVGFSQEDGKAILTLIQRFLKSQRRGEAQAFLLHRFKNLDDVEVPDHENSAFCMRERAEGIELTVSNWLQPEDDLSNGEIGGMSVCISRSDVERLANEFAVELRTPAPHIYE